MNGKYDFFTTRVSPRMMLVFPRSADCLFIRTALTQQFCPVGSGWGGGGRGLSTKADPFLWNIRMATNDCRICH